MNEKGSEGCWNTETDGSMYRPFKTNDKWKALANRSYRPGEKEKRTRKLTMSLHNTQEFDDHLGRGADQNLSLATPLGVDDIILS